VTVSANVELVRSIYATWERGDFSSVAAWVHPEIETVVPDGPEPGRWKGLAGLAEAWRRWTDAWTDFRAEVEEVRELDDERVLVLIHRTGRGKGSGLELDQIGTKGVAVYHFRDGKVAKIVNYFDHDRALADLGLAPQAD
jgi:ketosteroid isomerase-like protein